MRLRSALLLPVLVSCTPVDPPCTPRDRPVVAVHGFLAAGDTWAPLGQRFASNGQCFERVHAFDCNSLAQGPKTDALDAFVDRVRASRGAEQVDLIGHSAGGGLGYEYLADAARARKVARYAHLASLRKEAPAGPAEAPVPTLNLWSESDRIVADGGDIPGAVNARLEEADHYEVATSAASFARLTEFLDGRAPATTAIAEQEAARLAGKALELGTNAPLAGGTVEVRALDARTGERDEDPAATFSVGTDGAWGPFDGRAGVPYELVARGADPAAAPVHYYREPFARTNDLVYLRTFPPPDTLAGALLSAVEYDDDHAVLVVFLAARGLRADRDALSVDGTALPLAGLATPERTLIALFLTDADGDGRSSLKPIAGLSGFPFLGGLDVALPTDRPRTVEVRLNDRVLRVRNWKSETEGPAVAVFD